MAKLKERELKILSALSQLTEPTRPTEIGQLVGEIPLNTGRALTELGKGRLAVQTDEEQNLWAVTETTARGHCAFSSRPIQGRRAATWVRL